MKNQEEKPSNFIVRLCNILRSKQYAKIICWDSQNKGIRILNQKKLEEIILPKYYRHNRISSFVRQLNMYDFHKIYTSDQKSVFIHSHFDPRKKEEIHLIKRKITFSHQKCDIEKEESPEQKENLKFTSIIFGSKLSLIKNSFRRFPSIRFTEIKLPSNQQILEELLEILKPQQKNQMLVKEQIKQLKKNKKYRKYLKNRNFLQQLYEKIDIEFNKSEILSDLSIQDELAMRTNKSIKPISLKMLDSRQILFKKDTLWNM